MSVTKNYTLEEAAELLRCFPRYLEDNLAHLPHQKIGAAVSFDDDEIQAIKDMHRVRPIAKASAADAIARTPTLTQIQPKRRRSG